MEAPPDPFPVSYEAAYAPGNQEPADFERNAQLAEDCRRCFDNGRDFRLRRQRARNYYRGRQWDETMAGRDGEAVTEKEWIESQGRLPAINQQISPVVRNLKGQLGLNKSDPEPFPVDRDDSAASEMMSAALRGVFRSNRMERLDPAQFEELVISGAEAYRVSFSYLDRTKRDDVRIDPVAPDRLFFNDDVRDVRLDGLRLVGELHDLTPDECVRWFARDRQHEAALRAVVHDAGTRYSYATQPASFDKTDALTWHTATDPEKVRVVEAWHAEYAWVQEVEDPATGGVERFTDPQAAAQAVDAIYSRVYETAMSSYGLDPATADAVARQQTPEPREDYRPVWYCTFMTPDGTVLWEDESPYHHAGHPYAIGLALRVDGETWGLVEELIDSQRMTNRISSAIDHIFGTGSKGPLVYDKEAVEGGGMSGADVDHAWTTFGGTLGVSTAHLPNGHPAKGNPAALFKQFDAVQIPGWLMQWMELWTERIKQTSGVSGALMGGAPTSGTPASLYQLQVIQSSTNVRDYFDTHFETRREAARLAMQLVAQHYDAPRQIRLGSGLQPVAFDPAAVRTLDWDIAAADVTDTAVGWQLFEDDLKEFLGAGHLTFGEYLQASGHPQAESILQLISQRAPAMLGAPGGAAGGELEALTQAHAMGGPQAAEQLLTQMRPTPTA